PPPDPMPASGPTPQVIPSASGGLRIGLSYPGVLTRMNADALAHTLDDAVALGAAWIRLDLAWDAVQPNSPDAWDWSSFDSVVAAAGQRHLGVLPILQYTPTWARPILCTQSDHCAPSDPNQFAAFAGAAARRYASNGIHAWEVWNEPNTDSGWMPKADPGQYASLVGATSRAIKAADAAAVVISGGLAPAVTGQGEISQIDFLTGFAQAGGLASVDAIGYHPYSMPVLSPGFDLGDAWQQMSSTPRSFQSVLTSFGFPGMKIWSTEYGAPTNGPGPVATAANPLSVMNADHVDEQVQALMASQSVARAKSSPLVAALFWYTQSDSGTDSSNREDFFGLRRADGSAKPAYGALQQAIAAARN
ncbi:MAG TPA: cellulase family glycosylhydrolase, partial [Actinomycetota bacterium]|nr:cellulase family glycosylhydrolase [Actinomycetota bacterium]